MSQPNKKQFKNRDRYKHKNVVKKGWADLKDRVLNPKHRDHILNPKDNLK
ncbi:hypothetical protein UFOVP1192_48 [uncultured Caudovirales phage]|uniref:Uncharacterized protein n=1 Tax=uncultured Caudovirales phage TaxID=2100421 RepID=A0A6J5R6J6_9CAUD|nr:hypothetical protein UFOVP1192_48 [uncultured Caudovirales phage]